MLKKIIFAGLFLCCFISCQNEGKTEQEIAKISISFNVERFDQKFAEATPKQLPELKENYPFLFPKRFPDSVWVNKMQDTIQLELNTEVAKVFPDFTSEKQKLHALFQHLKYYFPQFETPRVITITSDVDYRHNVVLSDSVLLIALDTYLGKDHRFYHGIQRYFTKNFRKEEILPDVAKQYAKKYIPRSQKRSLIAHMVYYGKIFYLEDKLMPQISAADKIGYTPEEMQWAKTNESQIWSYFIERDMLYETSIDLRKRFLDVGPFTKFGLNLDSQSPSELGRYIGWQIVKQYVDKNSGMGLHELLNMDGEEIFKKSNYKPKQD